MKRVLLLSVLLNCALLVLALWPSDRHPMLSTAGEADTARALPRPIRTALRSATDPAQMETTAWGAIESRDPATFVANLRAVGCPEQTIRDILVLRLGREYRALVSDFEAASARGWDYTRPRKDWVERRRQQTEQREEMQSKLERLFGQSWVEIAMPVLGWPPFQTAAYDFLAEDKRQQVRDLERLYRGLKQGLLVSPRSFADAETRAAQYELDVQKETDLARLLSPEEMKEYTYRLSPAAAYVRDHLPPAQSESDFRTMVGLAQQFELWKQPPKSLERRYGLMPDPDEEDDFSKAMVSDYAARKALFDERLKEAVGEERIAEQQAEQRAAEEQARKNAQADDEERARNRIVSMANSVGVSPDQALQFFERIKQLQPEMEPKIQKLEKSLKGSPEENAQAIKAAVKAELQKVAAEFLGDKAPAFIEKMDQ